MKSVGMFTICSHILNNTLHYFICGAGRQCLIETATCNGPPPNYTSIRNSYARTTDKKIEY